MFYYICYMKEENIKDLYPFQYYTFKNLSVIKQYLNKYMFNLEHNNELYIGNINGLLTMGDMLPVKMLKYFTSNKNHKATFILPENYKSTIDGLTGFREQVLEIIEFFKQKNQITIITYNVNNSDILAKIINTIKDIGSMKFDVAIMNPPYSKNLHLKIINEVIPYCETTINISPSTWAAKHNINQPKGKYREIFNNKIEEFIFIPHRQMNDIFGLGNAIEDGAIIIFKDGGKFDIMNYGFSSDIEKSVFMKIKTVGNEDLLSLRQTGIGTKKIAISNNAVALYTWHSGNNCYDALVKTNPKAIDNGICFSTSIEKTNFLDSLKTTFMDWFHKAFIVPGDNKITNYMFIMKDYTQPWTNKRFCDFFNITGYISDDTAEPNSEWEFILNSMK